MRFRKSPARADVHAAANTLPFMERSQNPRIERGKYDLAFEKAWEQIANQYSDDQASIKKARRKFLVGSAIFFILGAALAIAGGILYGTDALNVQVSLAFILLVVGCTVATLSVFLGFYFFLKIPRGGSTRRTFESFVENFITNYFFLKWPDLTMDSLDLQNTNLRSKMSYGECRTYLTALSAPGQELDCNPVDYLFKTGDAAMMMGAGDFVNMEFSSSTRFAFGYKGKRVVLSDLAVIRIEQRIVSNGKRTSVQYYPVECFDGIIAATDFSIDYPYALEVSSRSGSLRTPGLKTLEYELASDEFNKELDLRVAHEDGVALRKAFQPRMIAELCDLSGYNTFSLLRHKPGHTTAVYSSSSALNIDRYNGSKFFKSKEDAYKAVGNQAIPFFETVADLLALVDCDLLA